jgi:AraC-like DNA-binding protein
MRYFSRAPIGPLAHVVDFFWQINDLPLHARERILPSGTAELVFNLQENEFRIYDPIHLGRCRKFSGAMISGPYDGPFVIDARQHASVIGVHFKPGGVFPFLGMAVSELENRHVDLENLWGRAASELREQLCETWGATARFNLLENELLARWSSRPTKFHDAVPLALHTFAHDAAISVRAVAKAAGISHRRFIEVFAREVGLSPKVFSRVRRFQRAIAQVQRATDPDWIQLAAECGYFDQSHLIRDFRLFSGLGPTDYLRQRSDGVKENHVPVIRGR